MSEPNGLPPQAAPQAGRPSPLGATWDGHGVNFALYSEAAEAVDLLLYDRDTDDAPAREVRLEERTGPIWHGYLPSVRPGQRYAYRVHGPWDPARGLRFNAHKVLLDPYAKALGRKVVWHDSLFAYDSHDPDAFDPSPSAAHAPLGLVVDDGFDWQGDTRPHVPWPDTIVYETHVRGLTMQHPAVEPRLRGTYLGLGSPPVIEHLQELGVTSLSLLPVHAHLTEPQLRARGLRNYWGYNPLAYFAPEPAYAAYGLDGAVSEFKTMVRDLHAAGFEVFIDVVYNHTSEGGRLGPTLSWRGIDNDGYYKLQDDDKRKYVDYTGTGNTLDAGNPFVIQMITDSLRYWVETMHVDGFRFDLASVLARELYDVDMLAPFFTVIQQDPVLRDVKLIAEPWDVGPGGYQVGNFPWTWAEWNGRYRDGVRGYWTGRAGGVGEIATRLSGSADLYDRKGRRPFASINFVTAHDGFTLRDMVTYAERHNHANGEKNRDGHAHEISTNFGVEGPTDDAQVRSRRERAQRGLFTTLMLSQGVPMMLGGDELSRTQGGNNNAYCQDNAVSWYDWDLAEGEHDFLAFARDVIAFRRKHPVFRRWHFLTGEKDEDGCKDVSWWTPAGAEMQLKDWQDHERTALGMLLCGRSLHEPRVHGRPQSGVSVLTVVQGRNPQPFRLPPVPSGTAWRVALTTATGEGPQVGDTLKAGDSLPAVVDAVTVFEEVT